MTSRVLTEYAMSMPYVQGGPRNKANTPNINKSYVENASIMLDFFHKI